MRVTTDYMLDEADQSEPVKVAMNGRPVVVADDHDQTAGVGAGTEELGGSRCWSGSLSGGQLLGG